MNQKLQNVGLIFGAVAVGVLIYKINETGAAMSKLADVNTDGNNYTKTSQSESGIYAAIEGGGEIWV